MATTQYIGARYVPLFAEPLDWDSTKTYEALTIVYYAGNSYTSRQVVPKGIDITNEKYWALTGNYNAQIEAYRKEVQAHDGKITQNAKDIAAEVTNRIAADSTLTTNLNSEITRAKAAESTLTTNLKAEVTRAKAAESTLTTNLNAEVTRAKGAESTLTANLNSEVTRAKGAESTLTANLNSEISKTSENTNKLNATVISNLLTNAIANSGSNAKALSLIKKGTLTPPSGYELNSLTVDGSNNVYALFSKTGNAQLIKYNSSLTKIASLNIGDIHGNAMNYRKSDNRIYILGYGKIASVSAATFSDLQTVTTDIPFQSFAFDETNNLIICNIGGSDTVAMYRISGNKAYIIGYKNLGINGNNYAQDSCFVNSRYITCYGYTNESDSPFVISACDIYGNLKQLLTINKNFISETEFEGIAVLDDYILLASITGNVYQFAKSTIKTYDTNANNFTYERCWFIPNIEDTFYTLVTTAGGTKVLIKAPCLPLDTLAHTLMRQQFDFAKDYRYGGHGVLTQDLNGINLKIQYNLTNGNYWLRYVKYGSLNATFNETDTIATYKTKLDAIFTTNIGNVAIIGYGIYPFSSGASCLIQLKN